MRATFHMPLQLYVLSTHYSCVCSSNGQVILVPPLPCRWNDAQSRSCFTLRWSFAFIFTWHERSGERRVIQRVWRSQIVGFALNSRQPDRRQRLWLLRPVPRLPFWQHLANQDKCRPPKERLPYQLYIPAIEAGSWTFNPLFFTTS